MSLPFRRLSPVAALAGLLLLGGCAGARVENLTSTASHSPVAPSTLRVRVSLAPGLDADPKAVKVAHALEEYLMKRYREAGLMALVYTGDPQPTPGAAIVQVRIREADPGDRTARLLIGFGAGRSVLRTDATILVTGEAAPALHFTASAKSGRKPGLILPGGIAAATGELTGLAIGGGAGLLLESRSDLAHDADRSAKLIVRQTRELYRTSGWAWPSA
jgi:hypothetical protein